MIVGIEMFNLLKFVGDPNYCEDLNGGGGGGGPTFLRLSIKISLLCQLSVKLVDLCLNALIIHDGCVICAVFRL